jgi:signal transduction histidine kinase
MFLFPENISAPLGCALKEARWAGSLSDVLKTAAGVAQKCFGCKDAAIAISFLDDPEQLVSSEAHIDSTALAPILEKFFYSSGECMRPGNGSSFYRAPDIGLEIPAGKVIIPFSSRHTLLLHQDRRFYGVTLLSEESPLCQEKSANEWKSTLAHILALASRPVEFGAYAHDVRHALMVSDELLRVIEGEDPALRELAVNKLKSVLRRMHLRTRSILLAEKDDSGLLQVNPMPININEIAVESISDQSELFDQAKITLAMNLADNLPQSPIDPAIFPSVVDNLLDNALKYSEKGAEVSISTSYDKNKTVILEVTNSGAEMSESEAAHVFLRHFRAENSRGVSGNGLGLHLVRRIVEAHNGTVEVSVLPGRKVRFRVHMPTV